jgi:predicted nucleic acid-binding Zn ribbon protein
MRPEREAATISHAVAARDLTSLKVLLPDMLARVARSSGSARLLEVPWREAVGEAIARRARPQALAGGVLEVQVASPEWARELQSQEAALLRRVAAVPSLSSIRALRFVARAEPSAAQEPTPT